VNRDVLFSMPMAGRAEIIESTSPGSYIRRTTVLYRQLKKKKNKVDEGKKRKKKKRKLPMVADDVWNCERLLRFSSRLSNHFSRVVKSITTIIELHDEQYCK